MMTMYNESNLLRFKFSCSYDISKNAASDRLLLAEFVFEPFIFILIFYFTNIGHRIPFIYSLATPSVNCQLELSID